MKRLIISAALLAISMTVNAEPGFEQIEKEFRQLPMEARRLTGPLFWMHGTETKEQLENELQKVVEGGNGIFTAEPRPHNDWLGENWYRDVDICLQFAKKNDLQMIIYDDYWWPSQMMGGRVPPEYGSKRIDASSAAFTGPVKLNEAGYGNSNLIAVVAGRVTESGAIDGSSLKDLTSAVKNGTLAFDVPAGKWNIMKFTWIFNGTKGGQAKYISVDGASPDCVEWFIKTVYQPHYDRFGKDFGKTIVGYFYDEPETQGDWGSDVPKLIKERKLDLAKLLVGYKFKLEGDEQTAAEQTYLNVFAESWGRTMYGGMSKWCKERNVYSMGHFMEHDNCFFSKGMSGGNMMQLQKYSDMGGIDLVCNQLYPGERKMGVYQTPKMASSISHAYDKKDDIAFCEIYGGYGQKVTYPEMKWLADWHHVRGVNMLIPHSFNPKAPFDRDYPPYFYNGGFEPRWPLYRVWADYTSRLSTMLTGGKHVCEIAFLHIGQSIQSGKAVRPEEFTSTIQDALYDCDWLNYDAFEDDASLSGRDIKLHKEKYQVLVVPPVEVIPYATLAKAKEFFDKGGVVIGYGFLPAKSATLGRNSADIKALCEAVWGTGALPGTEVCRKSSKNGRSYLLTEKPSVADLTKVLAQDAGIKPALEVVEGDTGSWLHILHRVKSGRDVFFVCNQNANGAARKFKFRSAAKGVPEIWDAMRNELNSVPCVNGEFSLTLEPMESVLVVFQKNDRRLPLRIEQDTKPVRELPVVSKMVKKTTPPEAPDAELKKIADGRRYAASPVVGDPFEGTCEIPADIDMGKSRICLVFDDIAPEAGANVKVNGVYAGGLIGKPFRLDITKHLKAGANAIVLEPFTPKNARLAVYSL